LLKDPWITNNMNKPAADENAALIALDELKDFRAERKL
jgi:hypothetical protein